VSPRTAEEGEPTTNWEIIVRGEAGPTVRSAFDDLVVTVGTGWTALSGELVDQSAVFGVLARVQDLGLELVAVWRLDPGLAAGSTDSAER
jgi:hypothetical protein